MSHEKLRPEFHFDEKKINQLKQIVPECFEDGKINFETLKQNLGEWIQDEDGELEHFGLFWPGKKDARRIAAIPPEGTLVPVYGDGLKADGTPDDDGVNDSKNIFIEGENLEVLKILQKSYAGKIKMIYIDPPYNTGNDFVYDDDFTEPLQEYLRRTGQVDEEGKALTTNKRSDGRFHSKWLSMMYPRLRLARNLLREDGVIFISIDDNELHNLKALTNEIFGEENFVAQFIWEKRINRENRKVVSNRHDYILCFSKDIYSVERIIGLLPMDEDALSRYKNPDNDPRGDWTSVPAIAQAGHGTKSQFYTLTTPSGREVDPPSGSCWRYTLLKMQEAIEDNRIWFGSDGQGVPRIKKFLDEGQQGLTPESIWWAKDVGTNDSAKRELTKLFDGIAVFETPKPASLVKRIVQLSTSEDEICLDFFSGTAPLSEAVIRQNLDDGGKRRWVCIQLPELLEEESEAYKAGFRSISDISKERIKRISKVMQSDKIDLGFNSLTLITSNYKKWSNYSGTSVSELEKNLDLFNQDPLREGWTKEGLISEIILIEGFVLSSTIDPQMQYTKNEVKKVSDEYCEHSLLICLDKKIAPETIESLELSGNDIFICLDSAISNVDKLRLSDKGLIKTI